MDSSELKAACEMAGLVFDPFMRAWHTGDALLGTHWTIEARHPALPAYVAELLTAKVRERELGEQFTAKLVDAIEDRYMWPATETAEQRIRAAMAVLGGEE